MNACKREVEKCSVFRQVNIPRDKHEPESVCRWRRNERGRRDGEEKMGGVNALLKLEQMVRGYSGQ